MIEKIEDIIHSADLKMVLTIAGGGVDAVYRLMRTPGASNTILAVNMPYSKRAFQFYLGHPVLKFVSETSAKFLAARAYADALVMREGEEPVVGISCTATLKTLKREKGDHKAYIASYDGNDMVVYSLLLAKGVRDRAGEDIVVGQAIIKAIADASEIDTAEPWLAPDEELKTELVHWI